MNLLIESIANLDIITVNPSENSELKHLAADCLIIPVTTSGLLTATGELVNNLLDNKLKVLLSQDFFSGQFKTFRLLPIDLLKILDAKLINNINNINIKEIVLVGCGDNFTFSENLYKQLVKEVASLCKRHNYQNIATLFHELSVLDHATDWPIEQWVLALNEIYYHFEPLKTQTLNPNLPNSLNLAFPNYININNNKNNNDLIYAAALASGINYCKNLALLPPNICTPSYLADQALKLRDLNQNLTVEILDTAAMAQLGMHSLLSVAQASGQHNPPKLIILNYKHTDLNKQPIVLVGKGITFDSGGMNLKTSGEIADQKYDMCGAATLLAMIYILAKINLKINVVAVIPAVENLIGGHATRPSDVIKSLSGLTIEILNTDAEGRLVLCDALTYSQKFNPYYIIDVATLTGAAVTTLGQETALLFSNDKILADLLYQSGKITGDNIWPLPITDEAKNLLQSDVADLRNVAFMGNKAAPSMVAAAFLAEFAKNYRWAHLDIAAVATKSGNRHTRVPTGRPLALLFNFLKNIKY